jgi:virginiamycin B lyase
MLGVQAVTHTDAAGAATAVVTTQRDARFGFSGGLTAGPNGDLWFTNSGPASIGRLAANGTITTFSDPALFSPGEIVPGTGRFWFTNGTNSIGHITTDGVVTTFTDPQIWNVTSLVEGPDGALWFTVIFGYTQFSDGWLGRITVDGDLTIFDGPDAFYPMGIVRGTDGALWYTSPVGNFVGRITTGGVTSRVVDDAIRFPTNLVVGADGVMWSTVGDINARLSVVRVTPLGAVDEIANAGFPTASGGAVATMGSDGAFWFRDTTERLYRISSAGAITSSTHPDFAVLTELVPGAAGAVHGRIGLRVFPDFSFDPGGIARIAISVAPVVTATAAVGDGGGTVSTGAAPDPVDPIGASVTVPGPGTVSIVEQTVASPPPTGYALVGRAIDIEAPPATAAAPLRLSFAVDGSVLASLGITATSLAILRNGVFVPNCTSPQVATAAPDPCVFERTTLAGGDARIGVYTSAASRWNVIGRACRNLAVTTTALPAARIGRAYSARLTACGGTTPYKFKKAGALPKGLKLAPKTGVISGVPKKRTGAFAFTVSVLDSRKPRPRAVATRPLSIRVS